MLIPEVIPAVDQVGLGDKATVSCGNFVEGLQTLPRSPVVDVVFLDPPWGGDSHSDSCCDFLTGVDLAHKRTGLQVAGEDPAVPVNAGRAARAGSSLPPSQGQVPALVFIGMPAAVNSSGRSLLLIPQGQDALHRA